MGTFLTKKPLAATLLGLLLVLLGAGIGYWQAQRYYEPLLSSFKLNLDAHTPYQFLEPLLWVSVPSQIGQSNLGSLRTAIQNIIADAPAGAVARYSVYFRDLNTGEWLGINQDGQYDPASLLKVVAAIAVYKQEEAHPGYLDSYLTFTGGIAALNQELPFALPGALIVGQQYQVRTLVRGMLSDSDNDAKNLLLSSIDQNILDSVYTDLSVPKPNDTDSSGYQISAVDYSRFFRILYYGTYNISWQDSNQLLTYLSQSSYEDGLAAGVPEGVVVAHKYGEHVFGANGVATGLELSDCGIIYQPGHPYFLCIMTQGTSEQNLSNVIASISQAVFAEVDSRYAK